MVEETEDVVDMDELSKDDDVEVDEVPEKEPDATIGDESDIDDDAEPEPDSTIKDVE